MRTAMLGVLLEYKIVNNPKIAGILVQKGPHRNWQTDSNNLLSRQQTNRNNKDKMKTFCAAVVMAASAFAENIAPQVNQQFVQQHQEQQYNTGADQRQDGAVVSAGEWINVGDNQWANAPQNEYANVPNQWGYAQPSPARNPWE